MFDNLENPGLLDAMLTNFNFYKANRVGREHLTELEMWEEWISD